MSSEWQSLRNVTQWNGRLQNKGTDWGSLSILRVSPHYPEFQAIDHWFLICEMGALIGSSDLVSGYSKPSERQMVLGL